MNKKKINYFLFAIVTMVFTMTSFIYSCERQKTERPQHGPKHLVICVGVQKGGTSSFWHYFHAHPNVVKSKEKEVNFFNKNFNKGIEWYKDQLNYSVCADHLVYSESSPEYMNPNYKNDNIPKLIHSLYPNAKLVVFLRNPTDRAWSHYKMILRDQSKNKSFEDVIKANDYYILSRGLYSKILKSWFEYFSKDQIFIIKSEDFFTDPNKVMNEVFEFVGLPNFDLDSYFHHHNSADKTDYPPLNPETREYLVNYFKPYNQELENLLGRKFNWE